jgi:heterodisulfide reductase subunit A
MDIAQTFDVDILVVGGGIAGIQAALDLADQGYQVALLERDTSIGGKMIRLSKVFPTLDCSSCITTPKMAAAAHHDNITIFTYCDLKSLERKESVLTAFVMQRPRYVDPIKCIGCRQCEYSCPVYVADKEEGGFSARKAIYIPFSNAFPQIALIDVEHCILCGKCENVCPAQAVDYFQKPQNFIVRAKTAVLATGFELTAVEDKHQYGGGKIPNVITALQMERLLAPHGPYNRVLRPTDGMEPDSIAYIQCAGSRDKSMWDFLLLPCLLHVCYQAGHASVRFPAACGHHHLLYGYSGIW